MIDIHILVTGEEYRPWLDKAIHSVRSAPGKLHLCDGIPGNIPEARARAISKGKNPYVGWVDSDDYALDGAYQKLLNSIGNNSFAWMKEYEYRYDIRMRHVITETRSSPHHIHIIHRDIINYTDIAAPPANSNGPAEAWICPLAERYGVFVDDIGYVYRKYNKKMKKLLSNPEFGVNGNYYSNGEIYGQH